MIVFDYPAKSGQRRVQAHRRPGGRRDRRRAEAPPRRGEELLAYKRSRRWVDVRSPEINEYLKEATGADFSAKDFRTWNATVLAAVALAVAGEVHTKPADKRAVARGQGGRPLPGQHARRRRASYIDPRVFDTLQRGPDDRRRPGGDRRAPRQRRPADAGADRRGRDRPARARRGLAGDRARALTGPGKRVCLARARGKLKEDSRLSRAADSLPERARFRRGARPIRKSDLRVFTRLVSEAPTCPTSSAPRARSPSSRPPGIPPPTSVPLPPAA